MKMSFKDTAYNIIKKYTKNPVGNFSGPQREFKKFQQLLFKFPLLCNTALLFI